MADHLWRRFRWSPPAELALRIRGYSRYSDWRALSVEELVEVIRPVGLVGTPEEVVEQIRTFEAAGVSEISLQWAEADDIEGLEMLAAEVLPHL